MTGAWIFGVPGLAAGRAGSAAAFSFVIGAVISLLVALPSSELSTAMPRSGGYYFVSRGLGTLPGAIVGIGLALGLVFASAFYPVGPGEYAAAILAEAGIVGATDTAVGSVDIVLLSGIGAGILLTVMSVFGTETTDTVYRNCLPVVRRPVPTNHRHYLTIIIMNRSGTPSSDFCSRSSWAFLSAVSPVSASSCRFAVAWYLRYAREIQLKGEPS
jgi:hypothetical protein